MYRLLLLIAGLSHLAFISSLPPWLLTPIVVTAIARQSFAPIRVRSPKCRSRRLMPVSCPRLGRTGSE